MFLDTSEGPRFVNADGKEMELTEEQRQEIISQLENQDHGAVVMVLNDDTISQNTTEETSAANTSDKKQTEVKSQSETPVVEKDVHKPRKTKHTVRTDVDEDELGEEMIEWLDEESGNIMKVPLSKFSKIGETDEDGEEEDEEEEEEEEEEEADEGTQKESEFEEAVSADETKEASKLKDEKSSDDEKDKAVNCKLH